MITLRDKIINKLLGTSGQRPVYLEDLRKIAEPMVDDMQQLYGLLDQLYAAHAVNRCSGLKDGQQYVAYWETGSIPPPILFRISTPAPLPQHRRIATPQEAQAKMQPAAPIAKPQPTAPKEAIVPQKQTQDRTGKLRAFVLELITKQPGISKASIVEYAEVEYPGETRICQTLGNLVTAKLIKSDGPRGKITYQLTGWADPKLCTPARAPLQAPAASAVAQAPTKAPVCKGPYLHVAFHMDGSMFIGQGEQEIELEPKDALLLMQFYSHQLPFADRVSA
jgi:hypothetical protein